MWKVFALCVCVCNDEEYWKEEFERREREDQEEEVRVMTERQEKVMRIGKSALVGYTTSSAAIGIMHPEVVHNVSWWVVTGGIFLLIVVVMMLLSWVYAR